MNTKVSCVVLCKRFLFLILSVLFLVIASSCDVESPGKSKDAKEREAFPCYEVSPNFKGIGNKSEISVADVMALGQLGGTLCPTPPLDGSLPENVGEENRIFANAMERWNLHDYKVAVKLLEDYLQRYPDGLWSGEAKLHIGCEARFNGRYKEANRIFTELIDKYKAGSLSGHKHLYDKASSRLAILRLLENNPEGSEELFLKLSQQSGDWALRTYAHNWMLHLAKKGSDSALADCGYRALESFLTSRGVDVRFNMKVTSRKGQSLHDLIRLAKEHGVILSPVKINVSMLADVEYPIIAQIDRHRTGGAGHYWIIEKKEGDKLQIYDAQMGRRFVQTLVEFQEEWGGYALVFNLPESLNVFQLDEWEAKEVFGGCCGIQRIEEDLGDPGDGHSDPVKDPPCENGGCPRWKINRGSLNVYIYDIPIWYNTSIGPQFKLKLSYNSQSALSKNEVFGNKWVFNFATYVVEDPGGSAAVFMPDGRRLIYPNDGEDGFARIYGTTARLERIADKKGYRLRLPDGTLYYYESPSETLCIERFPVPPLISISLMMAADTCFMSQQVFLTKIEDVNGNLLKLEYNDKLQLIKVIDASGQETHFSYNEEGLVTRVTDPFGRHADFEYSGDRDLLSITDMAGYTSRFEYGNNKYIRRLARPQGTWTFDIEPPDGSKVYGYPPPGGKMGRSYRITVTSPRGAKSEYAYVQLSSDSRSGTTMYVRPEDYIEYESDKVNNYRSSKKFNTQLAGGTLARFLSIPNAWGGAFHYRYDKFGMQISERENWQGQQREFSYNNGGQLIQEVEKDFSRKQERYRRYEYLTDNLPLMTRVVETAADEGELETTIDYDAHLNVERIVRGNQNMSREWRFKYTSKGQLAELDGPRTDVNDTTIYRYYDCSDVNSCNRLKSETNALGETTYYQDYKVGGLVGKIVYPNGLIKLFEYDGLERISKVTLRADSKVLGVNELYYAFPQQGPTRIRRDDGRELNLTYNEEDQLVKVTDQEGNYLVYERDQSGRVTAQKRYDKEGHVLTGVSYEKSQGSLIRILGLDGKQRGSYSIDLRGLMTGITYGERTGRDKYYSGSREYDAFGQVVSSYGYPDGDWYYSYTSSGKLARINRPGGKSEVTAYKYNVFGELIGEDSYTRGMLSYAYDNAGHLITKEDARGVVTHYHYDALGRNISVTTPSSKEDVSIRYSTTGDSNVSVSDEDGDSLFEYDPLGRLVHLRRGQGGESFDISYKYGVGGTLDELVYPSGRTVTYLYDTNGRVSGITTESSVGNSSNVLKKLRYRGDGKMEHITYANGRTLDFSYDTDGRLTSLVNSSGEARYLYNQANDLVEIQKGTFSEKYDYDRVRRLIYAKGVYGVFHYTLNYYLGRISFKSNSLVVNYRYNNKNRHLIETVGRLGAGGEWGEEPVKTLSWDTTLSSEEGKPGESMLVVCPGSGRLADVWGDNYYSENSSICSAAVHAGLIEMDEGGRFRVVYENILPNYSGSVKNGVASKSRVGELRGFRLMPYKEKAVVVRNSSIKTVFSHDAAGNTLQKGEFVFTYNDRNRMQSAVGPNIQATYKYDSMRRRSSKVVNGIRTDYFYDRNGRLLAWREGTVWYENIYLGNTIIAVLQNDRLYFVEPDRLGRAIRLVDEAGDVVWTGEWEVFRESDRVRNGVNYLQRFPGQILDEETGLYYNIFREYDPDLGRYTQNDPIGLAGGMNPYLYAEANPVMYTDPLGLAVCYYTISQHTMSCIFSDEDFIVIGPKGVFSGSKASGYVNDPSKTGERLLGPIPPGEYKMLPDPRNGGQFYLKNKTHDLPIVGRMYSALCTMGYLRCGFMFHKGTISDGCITVDKTDQDLKMQFNKLKEKLLKEEENTLFVY